MPEDNKDINFSDLDTQEKKMEQIRSLIQSAFHNLEKISRIVDRIEQEERKEMYKKMPGAEGYFDGVFLVIDDGSKQEVPANYAAKSRLAYGDRLKIVEENGKKVFKQIQKVERKEVNGVLHKKEGKWYLLADSGTYKISDVAAEFNQAVLNDEAVGIIPADNANVPFAALDRVTKKEIVTKEEVKVPVKEVKKEEKPKTAEKKLEVKVVTKPVEITKPTPKKENNRPVLGKPEPRIEIKQEVKPEPHKEFVANILEEDDLR